MGFAPSAFFHSSVILLTTLLLLLLPPLPLLSLAGCNTTLCRCWTHCHRSTVTQASRGHHLQTCQSPGANRGSMPQRDSSHSAAWESSRDLCGIAFWMTANPRLKLPYGHCQHVASCKPPQCVSVVEIALTISTVVVARSPLGPGHGSEHNQRKLHAERWQKDAAPLCATVCMCSAMC